MFNVCHCARLHIHNGALFSTKLMPNGKNGKGLQYLTLDPGTHSGECSRFNYFSLLLRQHFVFLGIKYGKTLYETVIFIFNPNPLFVRS